MRDIIPLEVGTPVNPINLLISLASFGRVTGVAARRHDVKRRARQGERDVMASKGVAGRLEGQRQSID